MKPNRSVREQRGGFLVWVIGVAVLATALLVLYTWFVVTWSYSSGERAGWVQKLSHKGWLCKTWEGELSMVAMPGAAPEKFYFSVWDDKVAAEINRNMGKRVSLHYEEKVGVPTSCFGDTRYFVTGITIVDQTQGVTVPAGPAAPATESPAVPGVPGASSVPQPR